MNDSSSSLCGASNGTSVGTGITGELGGIGPDHSSGGGSANILEEEYTMPPPDMDIAGATGAGDRSAGHGSKGQGLSSRGAWQGQGSQGSSSGTQTPVSDDEFQEWRVFLEISNNIDSVFCQLRDSNVLPHIVAQLRRCTSIKDSQTYEELICYCLHKHSHPRIRYLMKQVEDLIQSQQLERAVTILTEVCAQNLVIFCTYVDG
jgi:hypothetical protein